MPCVMSALQVWWGAHRSGISASSWFEASGKERNFTCSLKGVQKKINNLNQLLFFVWSVACVYGNGNYCLLLDEGWGSGILGICSPDWSGHRLHSLLFSGVVFSVSSIPPLSPVFFPAPSPGSFCSTAQDSQASPAASHWPSASLSPVSSCQFQFLSILASVSWQTLLPGSPCNQMGQLLLFYSIPGNSWTFRNALHCFPDVF